MHSMATTLAATLLGLLLASSPFSVPSSLSLSYVGIVDAQQYLFTVTHNDTSTTDLDAPDSGDGQWLSAPLVSNTDDAAWETVSLPFEFPFYGTSRTRMWLAPNGGVHFLYEVPCLQRLSARSAIVRFPSTAMTGNDCNINDYFNDAILAFLADLDPGASSNGTVAYREIAAADAPDDGHGARVVVKYDRVPLHEPSNRNTSTFTDAENDMFAWQNNANTFSVTIMSTGRIDVHYHRIMYPPSLPGGVTGDAVNATRVWIVGLRQAHTLNPTLPDTHPYRATQRSWGEYTANGIYPAQDDVVSNTRISYCLFGTRFCALAHAHTTAALATTTVSVYITTPQFSCLRDGDRAMHCVVLSDDVTDNSVAADATQYPLTYDSTSLTMRCDVVTLTASATTTRVAIVDTAAAITLHRTPPLDVMTLTAADLAGTSETAIVKRRMCTQCRAYRPPELAAFCTVGCSASEPSYVVGDCNTCVPPDDVGRDRDCQDMCFAAPETTTSTLASLATSTAAPFNRSACALPDYYYVTEHFISFVYALDELKYYRYALFAFLLVAGAGLLAHKFRHFRIYRRFVGRLERLLAEEQQQQQQQAVMELQPVDSAVVLDNSRATETVNAAAAL